MIVLSGNCKWSAHHECTKHHADTGSVISRLAHTDSPTVFPALTRKQRFLAWYGSDCIKVGLMRVCLYLWPHIPYLPGNPLNHL